LIGQFCRQDIMVPPIIMSSHRSIWIRFVSDMISTRSGFQLEYKFTSKNIWVLKFTAIRATIFVSPYPRHSTLSLIEIKAQVVVADMAKVLNIYNLSGGNAFQDRNSLGRGLNCSNLSSPPSHHWRLQRVWISHRSCTVELTGY